MNKLTIEHTGDGWCLVTSGNRFIVLTKDEAIAFVARALLNGEEWWGLRTYEQEIRNCPFRFVDPDRIAGLLAYTPIEEPKQQFTADFLYNPAA